jgi:hypothetical protein
VSGAFALALYLASLPLWGFMTSGALLAFDVLVQAMAESLSFRR